MSATGERIRWLASEAAALKPWVGEYDEAALQALLSSELGDAGALDSWVARGSIQSRAVALSPVLHVVSGNTPHAAFQSVFRALLVGAHSRVKLPSAGLPEFEEWFERAPEELRQRIDVRHELPEEWLMAPVAVIFGDADTMEFFRKALPATTRRIEHGPKLSVAVAFSPEVEMAALAADVLRYDQKGCLSTQAVFVAAQEPVILGFGDRLAEALQAHRQRHPRVPPSLSDSGAVANAREVARFRAANGAPVRLWESEGSTDWTVIYDRCPRLAPGPLNGCVTLHPWPEDRIREALGKECAYLSTVAIAPFVPETAARLDELEVPRICSIGASQEPTIFWHADGTMPLAELVKWRDLG